MRIISYNVDGLPESIDLMDLPKWLRFIAWIYKKIKGTTIVKINDGSDRLSFSKKICSYLSSQNADIIVVQEYFNYPFELNGYNKGSYMGGFDISKIPSNMTLFPPRFKCDGLCIFTKYNIVSEDIVPWKESYGYFGHANDKLTRKGFRRYRLDVGSGKFIDIYNVHMDADFHKDGNDGDNIGDIRARMCQIKQLVSYVGEHSVGVPVVVIGDTNSYTKYSWDEENIGRLVSGIGCTEIVPNNGSDCDRVFTVGIDSGVSRYALSINYSDHKPLVVDLDI